MSEIDAQFAQVFALPSQVVDLEVVEELTIGVDGVIVSPLMTRELDANHAEVRLSCELRRWCLNCDPSVVVDTPSIHQEALSGRSTEYQHLLWSKGEGSHRAWPHELAVLDFKLSPLVLCHWVAIASSTHIAWELTGRSRIQTTDEQGRASLTLSTVPRHQVNFLVVHDNGTGAHARDWQTIDLEPVVGHRVKGLTTPRPLRLIRLTSDGKDESIVDEC